MGESPLTTTWTGELINRRRYRPNCCKSSEFGFSAERRGYRQRACFWHTDKADADGRPVWVGSAVYDERVGLSRTTGEVTHVTAPDVDAERDYLFHDLERTGDLAEWYVVDDFHKQREGRNGGGDPWHTDGKLYVGIIAVSSTP